MGSCFSLISPSSSSSSSSGSVRGIRLPTANIITSDGRLREYALPATASQVLLMEGVAEEAFLCSSDALCFDEHIPSLEPQQQLQPGQIYFSLPKARLLRRLSASDMAALAVKASVALPPQPPRHHKKKKNKGQISPAVQQVAFDSPLSNSSDNNNNNNYNNNERTIGDSKRLVGGKKSTAGGGGGMSRSSSLRKVSKYSSKRARMAVRSFRLRLNTIYEGSVLDSIGRSSRHHRLNADTVFG